ncbi:MAG: preprotein translocase subunit SecG [Rhabdochlamydiaceae bacterium]|nr:preprotein translocase subunit SecG [Rhabdochlamydiaceae bacterium]
MTFLFYLAIFFFMLLCGILCLVILIQESKSLGLGASFGGDPGESLFGTSTAAVLKKFTGWLVVVFMVACVLLSIWSASIGENRIEVVPPTIEEVQQ